MTARLLAAIDATEAALTRAAAKASYRPWNALEQALAEILTGLLALEAARLVRAIEQAGSAAAVEDAAFWQDHRDMLADELSMLLAQIARQGAQDGRESVSGLTVGLGVNWGLVNQNAVAAAQTQVGALIAGVTETARAAVREAVAEWIQSGQPLSALTQKIQSLTAFSPARARMIAQTESTNAFALGNATAWEAAGVLPAAFKPAAHVQCRCYLQPLRLDDGTTVMVWYTAHDERVCTQEIETPWGSVDGCAALHNTIVSRGAWMGSKKP